MFLKAIVYFIVCSTGAMAAAGESENLLVNGDFSKGTNNWTIYRAPDVASSVTVKCEKGLSITMRKLVDKLGAIQLLQEVENITAGDDLRLSFYAQAEKEASCGITFSQKGAPFKTYGLSATAAITRTWQKYEYRFRAYTIVPENPATIRLLFGTMGENSISFKDFELKKERTAPRSKTLGPVITAVLGTGLGKVYFAPTDAEMKQAVKDIQGAGFTTSWDASPQVFAHKNGGLLTNEGYFLHYRKLAAVLRAQGIGIAFGFQREVLLPGSSSEYPDMYGERINTETSDFEKHGWNIGSEAALLEFRKNTEALLKKIGNIEMFYSDEVILGEPGKNANFSKVSTYWTSPTYSRDALSSFRKYLALKNFPNAASARFPVTTVKTAESFAANMGLPAIVINDRNRDRLSEDNDWPKSILWRHWYEWRASVNTEWIDTLMTAAHTANKNNPRWMGSYIEMPVFWMVPELGQDIKTIARLPSIDFIIAGYTTGDRYDIVKNIADAAGKKWGLQVEVSRYAQEKGMPVEWIENTFKNAVNDGASLITCYAGQSFRTDRTNVSEKDRKNGWYYMPDQTRVWKECVEWLRKGRGLKTLEPVKAAQ